MKKEYDYTLRHLNETDKREYIEYLKRLPKKAKVLTPQEERECLLNRHKEKYKKKLILSHYPLILSIALRYANKGVPLVDLIQEGITGLLIALNKFDIEKNNKFITYATLWIRQSIGRFVGNNGNIIRYPYKIVDKSYSYKHYDDRGMTLEQIKEKLQLGKFEWEILLDFVNTSYAAPDEMESVASFYQAPESKLYEQEKQEALVKMLSSLKEKHLAFLDDYYGFTKEKMTVDKMLEKYNRKISFRASRHMFILRTIRKQNAELIEALR